MTPVSRKIITPYENGKHLKEFENRISISLSCGLHQLNLCFMADNLGIDIFLISTALEKQITALHVNSNTTSI